METTIATGALKPKIAISIAVILNSRDLGYGDLRTLPAPVAWIDQPRRTRKRCALVFSCEAAESAAGPAGIRDRFDAAVSGRRGTRTLARALAVDVDPAGTTAAREAGFEKAIAVARDGAGAEDCGAAAPTSSSPTCRNCWASCADATAPV